MKRVVPGNQPVSSGWQSGPNILPTRMMAKSTNPAMQMDPTPNTMPNTRSMPKIGYPISFMKTTNPPPTQMHTPPPMKKPVVSPYEEERRRLITDSDAAIEGLMFLKASTQMPHNEPFEPPMNRSKASTQMPHNDSFESPMKRPRTSEAPTQTANTSRVPLPMTNFTAPTSSYSMSSNPSGQIPSYQSQRRTMPDHSKPSDIRILQFNSKDQKVRRVKEVNNDAVHFD
jgi:hypothetical protein